MVARWGTLFIKVGVAYVYRGDQKKLARALDKQFQFTMSYYIILLQTFKEAINYIAINRTILVI